MKTKQTMIKSRFSGGMIAMIIFLTGPLLGQVERKKEINETFNVDSKANLTISNKYGDVHINSWDKNVIELKVTVTSKKRNEARAMEYLDKVDIEISASSNNVTIETEINGNINSGKGESLRIDYLVSMPKTNNLRLKHSYGSLYLDDLEGNVNIKMSYGNMKVGNLAGTTEVKLSYGNGEVETIDNGELSIGYSNMNIEEIGNVDISSHYSNVEFQKAKDVTLSNKYGNFQFDDINSLKGSSKYGKVSISRLHNSLVLDLTYGTGVNVKWISKKFNWIEIDASYSGSTLNFERGFGAELQGYFKYCDLKYSKDDFDFSYIDKGTSSSEYKGRIGSGSGNAKIRLKSSYGSVRIGYSSLNGSD